MELESILTNFLNGPEPFIMLAIIIIVIIAWRMVDHSDRGDSPVKDLHDIKDKIKGDDHG